MRNGDKGAAAVVVAFLVALVLNLLWIGVCIWAVIQVVSWLVSK